MEKPEDICKPLNTIQEVLIFKSVLTPVSDIIPVSSFALQNFKNDCHHNGNKLLPRKKIHKSLVPKTLVCHDMKGGYLEDKYINGCNIGSGYTFYRWSNIDIFIYFSHHLVTIPPVGWIRNAHYNKVKILGTFITEFDHGVKICKEIFATTQSWQDFALSLVNICVTYSFDGWLLNIENPLENPDAMVDFVHYLTEELHKHKPGSIVLWYDSVTNTGALKWQNELNDLNKCYFDVCDGIFLNYTWKEENLKRSVLNAQERNLDVFVGLDVFGRNFFGGGGFNSCAAAEEIRKHNLSMAIFAQGWTHEICPTTSQEQFFDDFCLNDNIFWLKLYPYLYTRPIEKCFQTTFYLGSDKGKYQLNYQEMSLSKPAHCGQIFLDERLNIIKSDKIHEIPSSDACKCIKLYLEGCKPNTISYLISKENFDATKEYIHHLFSCFINTENNVIVGTVTKQLEKDNAILSIILLMEGGDEKLYNFKMDKITNSSNVGEYISFQGISEGWKVEIFEVKILQKMKLLEIGVILTGSEILLGGFAVATNCKF